MEPDEIRQSINDSLEVYYLRSKNRRMMEALENANRELLDLDGLKSEIINSISNEISTPLNRMMGMLHLLKTRIEGDELTEAVNILDQSVFKLEQFLLLARQISLLKSPGFRLQRNRVSLKQVIQFGSIETREELKEAGITLKKELEAPELAVDGDSGLLVSCLVSLIRFAQEHTPKKGEILVRTVVQDGKPACLVEDRGDNYSEALFENLAGQYSARDMAMNLSMGTGIALSRMIMEVHGGHLIFEKTDDNRGRMKMVFPHE
jgi:K+-sensing histidine kinase KdpD